MLLSAVAAPMRAAARPLRAATASTRRLSSSSVKTLHPDSLVTRLVWTVEDTVDERPLAAAIHRSLSSKPERLASLASWIPVYGALETALDGAAGAAGDFWSAHRDGLRRAPALAAARAAERPPAVFSEALRAEDDADERLWSPATKQYARRVAVAAGDFDGALLLGHCFAAHVYAGLELAPRLDYHGKEALLNFTSTAPPKPPALATALETLGSVAGDLEDDVQDLVVHEATRALKLYANLHRERPGVYRGAASAAWQIGAKMLQAQLRPSA